MPFFHAFSLPLLISPLLGVTLNSAIHYFGSLLWKSLTHHRYKGLLPISRQTNISWIMERKVVCPFFSLLHLLCPELPICYRFYVSLILPCLFSSLFLSFILNHRIWKVHNPYWSLFVTISKMGEFNKIHTNHKIR